jgi:hypothetical protein
MRHRHVNNRRSFGMLLSFRVKGAITTGDQPAGADQPNGRECVSVEMAKRRHAMRHGVPSSYWRLRHHHSYVMARPV